ncbi:uncharacterized protein HMPREF1541_04655 [Cyphellophora europaea CBS 101466]|uniref:Transcription factor domain-containing protein n=1 Tax=Cyphellophora europaea (strain CBS 101466) TaxID=1220924 RepID=W2RXA1_CYPE1|nr:uncharacterized protein HMPREF1541_04655 [Cyphellophora europaea CBS 101466]ETN40378.1 hypothetical protein HMPREF1541_04655 [Cyphellophora europaea CBS 101466]
MTPNPGGTNMATRTFSEEVTWVNKTPTNFRDRTRREVYTINSHINGSYARWKRKESSRRLRSELVPLPRCAGEPIDEDKRISNELAPARHVVHERPLPAASQPVSSTNTDSQHRIDTVQIRNAHSVLRRGNSDPFNSTVVPLTALNAHCHRLARDFQVGSIWGDEVAHEELKEATLNWWLADGIGTTHAVAMHGLLAWAYTSRLSIQAYPPQQIAINALEYKTLTIQELQKLVTNLTSFEQQCAAWEAMLCLAAIEWSAGNAEAVMLHMRSAHALQTLMGGFDVLPDPKRESAMWMFVSVCFHFATRPLVRPEDFDPGPLSAQRHLNAPAIRQIEQSARQASHGRSTGTVFSKLAGSRLVTLWEAMDEALPAVEVVRKNKTLRKDVLGRLSRWLFRRKLATRAHLDHLWHDTKSRYDEASREHQMTKDDNFSSKRHICMWQLCICMASRIFDGLMFEKLHPGEDATAHWTPYGKSHPAKRTIKAQESKFTRYLVHLTFLEAEEAEYARKSNHRARHARHRLELVLLWLYFMGTAVEHLIFHSTHGDASSPSSGAKSRPSCIMRFQALYSRTSHGGIDALASTFEGELIFAPSVMRPLLDGLVQSQTIGVV